ncbi:MAG: hypothetical protein IJ662_06145 [Clostridia bacterium]|nr:hypothetical protein [Clostridia bacterium]
MQNQAKKQKNKRELVYKPYHKGSWWDGGVVKKALKILLYYVMFVFVFVVVGGITTTESPALAWVINVLIIFLCAAMLFVDGTREGESQVMLGEIVHSRLETGKDVPQKDQDRCYHPLKGWVTALCGAALVIVIALAYAVQAKKQVYELQALPDWVTAYEKGGEVMLPLSYYQRSVGITVTDILRIVTRMLIFPFAQVARLYGADGLLLADRLSPLLACIPALGYPLGYLTGPRSRAMVHGDIKTNTKRYQRRQRKAVKARRQRTEKKNELI